jgi:F420-dependent oxidoreductase-like protein
LPAVRIGLGADPRMITLEDFEDEVAFASRAGLDTYWVPQVFGFDAMTVIPHLAARAPQLRFATGVVATYLRHPAVLAGQALTVSSLTAGRFTLGIGLMHRPVIEGMFGMSFDRPVRAMREYLDVLIPLLEKRPADASGETVSFHGSLMLAGAPSCDIIIAALGPQMLRLCGARTSGTITWMTGPKTLREHVVPTITAAAESAGRPPPRVVAAVPVVVTDDAAGARSRAASSLAVYDRMPSYRAMLDREGLAGPAEFVVMGTEDHVREQLASYAESGATDLAVFIVASGADERDRTRAFVASL